jgi:hypothetical protein
MVKMNKGFFPERDENDELKKILIKYL